MTLSSFGRETLSKWTFQIQSKSLDHIRSTSQILKESRFQQVSHEFIKMLLIVSIILFELNLIQILDSKNIEEKAFCYTNIYRIAIPASVTKICKHAFSFCEQLVRVEFQPNSQIREIDIEAFYGYNSNLRSISIPASVSKIF